MNTLDPIALGHGLVSCPYSPSATPESAKVAAARLAEFVERNYRQMMLLEGCKNPD